MYIDKVKPMRILCDLSTIWFITFHEQVPDFILKKRTGNSTLSFGSVFLNKK